MTKSKAQTETKKQFELAKFAVDFTAEQKALAIETDKAFALLEVTSDDELSDAINLLSAVKQKLEAIEAKKKTVTTPLAQLTRAISALFKQTIEDGQMAERQVKDAISKYQAERERKAREERERIEKQRRAGTITAATAERKLAVVESKALPNTVRTAEGASVTFKREKVLVIENEKKIPDKFWVLDEAAIRKALEAGEHVPGADLRDADQKGVSAS